MVGRRWEREAEREREREKEREVVREKGGREMKWERYSEKGMRHVAFSQSNRGK